MSEPTVILGPSTGSSRMKIGPSDHGRLLVKVTTDFGSATGIFDMEGARQMRDALNAILGTNAG